MQISKENNKCITNAQGGEGQGELSILGIDRAIIILIYVGSLSSGIKVHGLSNLTLKVPTKLS